MVSNLRKWAEDAKAEATAHARAHARAARRLEYLHYLLGVPTVVFAAASSAFTSLGTVDILAVKVLVGLTTLTAAIMASLQTFLNFAQRREQHRITEAAFIAYSCDVETLLLFPPDTETAQRRVRELNNRRRKIVIEGPGLGMVDPHPE